MGVFFDFGVSLALGPSNTFALWEWKLSGGGQVLEYQGPGKVCRDVLLSCGCYLCDLYSCTDSPGFFPRFRWPIGDAFWGQAPSPKNRIRQGYFHLWPSRKKLDRTDAGSKSCNQWPGWPYAAGQEVSCHKNVEGKKDSN